MSTTPEIYAPFAAIRSVKETAPGSLLDVASKVRQFDVDSAVVHADALNLATGSIDRSLGYIQYPGDAKPSLHPKADVIRIIRRLPVADRGLESDVPLLNPDTAFNRTIDKLKMAETLGDLAIPTRLLVAHSLSAEESRVRLQQASDKWGNVIIKKRTGQGGDGVFVGDRTQLEVQLDTILADPEKANYIVQPFLDSREAYKPGLPAEMQQYPTSLRVIGGVTQLPGMEPLAEVFTAYYRYSNDDNAAYHGGDHSDEYFFIEQPGQSVEQSNPELAPAFELAKQALLRGVMSSAEQAASTAHGVGTQFASTDILLLPPDSPYGFSAGPGAVLKPIVMEQNSATERLEIGAHDLSRNAWHMGEARMLASLALGEQIMEDR